MASEDGSVESVGTDPEDDVDLRPCDVVPALPPMPENWAGHPPEPVQELARWPQMTTLIRYHEDAVLKILHACDECAVMSEVAASDSGNLKGNKWVKVHDVVFGGRDDSSRGLIPQFPVIPLPSKFKKKVVAIWQFGSDPDKVPASIHRICVRQLKAHKDTVKEQAETNKAAKEKYAILSGQMREYEDSVGALPAGARVPPPPGSRPEDGGGRLNHSTNLVSRQPAAFGYVHQQSSKQQQPKAPTTPAASSSSNSVTTPANSTRVSSTRVNAAAMDNLNRLGNTFDAVVQRLLPRGDPEANTPTASTPSNITIPSNPQKRKLQAQIEKAKRKKKELEEQISFMRPMKDDSPDNTIHFKDITRQYIQVSREVVQLINETDVDDN